MADEIQNTPEPAEEIQPAPATPEDAPDAVDVHKLRSSLGRAEAEVAKLRRENEEAQQRLAELEAERKARAEAEMTALERAEQAAKDAAARADAAEQARHAAETDAMRSRIVAMQATDLLPTYRERISGDTEEAVQASIDDMRARQSEDARAQLAILLQQPEERLTEVLGEDLASQFIAKRRAPISGPSNAGKQPEPTATPASIENINGAGMSTWIARARARRSGS